MARFPFAWYSVAAGATRTNNAVTVLTADNTPDAIQTNLETKYWALNATSGSTTAPAANSGFYVSALEGGAFVNKVKINGTAQKTNDTGTAAVQFEAKVEGVSNLDTNQYELVITVGYKTDGETPAAGSGTVKYYYSSSDSALPSDSSVLAASAQTMSAVANSTGDYSVTLESTARNNWFVNIIVFVDGTADITYVPANFVVTATLQVKGA